MVLALGILRAVEAQGVDVSGRVIRVSGADSTPLAASWVILHRVTAREGGAVDSVRSDRAGRYRFGTGLADTVALYVISVTYQGIAYFTRPVHAFGGQADTADMLAVYDTSSVAPPVSAAQRHIVVRNAAGDGSRRVVELIVLTNAGRLTRIAPDTSRPVWEGTLPRGAFQVEVGESEISPQAVAVRQGRLAVSAPIPPGEKQLVVSYLLPADVRAVDLLADQPYARLNILVEDTAASVAGGTLTPMGFEEMEGATFAHFDGAVTQPGERIRVTFGAAPLAPTQLWWVIVALAGAAMAIALVLRLPRARAVVQAPEDAAGLAAQLRTVEAALAGASLTDAERAAYQRRQATLHDLLTRAGGQPRA